MNIKGFRAVGLGPMFTSEKCEATEYNKDVRNEMKYGIYFISNILLAILLQTVIDFDVKISSPKNKNCC